MNGPQNTPGVQGMEGERSGRRAGPFWGPVHSRSSWIMTAALIALFPEVGYAQNSPFAWGGGMPPGGVSEDLELVDQFDENGDEWLNAEERAKAREWLATEGASAGRGMRGGFPGMPGGPPMGGRPGGQGGPGRGPGMGPPDGAGPGMRGGPGGGPGMMPPGGFPGGPPGGFPGGPPGGFPMGGGGMGAGGFQPINPGTPGPRVDPADVETYGGVPLYDTSVLRTMFLTFESSDWEAELEAFKDTDVEVPARVLLDGVEYADVGVHFRGMSSFMMVPTGSKRSLNLSFDFLNDDQRVEGYRTLNLLNAMGDPTLMRAVLYSTIARDYIAAPAASFVNVVINGESWGLYISMQQYNKDFLRDFFDTTDGERWKVPGSPNGRGGLEYLGEDIEDYKAIYEIKTRDSDESWQALIELTRVLNETPVEDLEAALEPILDIDGTLKFLAIENVLVNSDGYWSRASDYSLYRDLEGRFHVIPHDMNEGLGSSGRPDLDPLVAIDDATKPLRSRLLAVPALRERYLGYVQEIATEWLDWDRLEPIVAEHRALIEEAVLADTRKLSSSENFATGIESLRTFVEARREFLLK